jgi:hypothetical protein
MVTASGWAPPMPPRPAVRVMVPARVPPNALAGDLGEALVGALQDPLRADVDPRPGRHLPVHGEAEVLEAAELVPVAQSGTRLELAMSTRGAHSWVRNTPTGLPDCTSIVSSASRVVSVRAWRRAPPSCGPPDRCRRRRPGRRAARPPRGRGCCAASGRPPPGASRLQVSLGVVGDHQPAVHAGVGGEERRQPVGARRVEQPVGAPLGDGAHLRRRDGQEVADEGHRRAVEVAARLHPTVGQDHRVVDGGVELALGHRPGVRQRVLGGTVHLRGAPQRVGVLHPRVVVRWLATIGDPWSSRRRLPRCAPARAGGAAAGDRRRRPGRCRAAPPPTWPR